MDETLHLALCLIKVLCLIVIAMSAHRLAYPPRYSYMGENGANLGFASIPTDANIGGFTGSSANEPPVFFPIGDWESNEERGEKQLGAELADARLAVASRLNSMPYPGSNDDMQNDIKMAASLGLVKSGNVWVMKGDNSASGAAMSSAAVTSGFSGGYSFFTDDELARHL